MLPVVNNIPSQSIIYMDHMLTSRRTYLKHQDTVMGPIGDSQGVEQGGIESSNMFQLITDSELKALNAYGLGIPRGDLNLTTLGKAVNQVLLTTSHSRAQSLVNVALKMASTNNLRNIPSKTKILIKNPKPSPTSTTLNVDGTDVTASAETKHLGIVKSFHQTSNSPALFARITVHSKSLYATLNLGLAKNQRTHPSTSLRMEAIFSSPVLCSSLAPILLISSEVSTLNV